MVFLSYALITSAQHYRCKDNYKFDIFKDNHEMIYTKICGKESKKYHCL